MAMLSTCLNGGTMEEEEVIVWVKDDERELEDNKPGEGLFKMFEEMGNFLDTLPWLERAEDDEG